MSFRLVPHSVTLNELERRNSPQLCVISPNSVAFGAHYVIVVEDTPMLFLRQKCSPKNVVLAISYGDIGRGSPPARALK